MRLQPLLSSENYTMQLLHPISLPKSNLCQYQMFSISELYAPKRQATLSASLTREKKQTFKLFANYDSEMNSNRVSTFASSLSRHPTPATNLT